MTNTDLIIKSMECWLLDITKQDTIPQDFTPLQIGFVKRLLEKYYSPQISVEAVKELRKSYEESMNDFKDMYYHWNDTVYWVRKTYERVIKDLDILLSQQQQDDTN